MASTTGNPGFSRDGKELPMIPACPNAPSKRGEAPISCPANGKKGSYRHLGRALEDRPPWGKALYNAPFDNGLTSQPRELRNLQALNLSAHREKKKALQSAVGISCLVSKNPSTGRGTRRGARLGSALSVPRRPPHPHQKKEPIPLVSFLRRLWNGGAIRKLPGGLLPVFNAFPQRIAPQGQTRKRPIVRKFFPRSLLFELWAGGADFVPSSRETRRSMSFCLRFRSVRFFVHGCG